MRKLVAIPLLAVALVLGSLVPSLGSSHREAPLISEDPVADTTDVYAFVSPDRPDTVTIVANWIPLEEPAGGPNFYKFGDDVRYEINIDNNGDAIDDIRYEFRFHTQVQNSNTFLYNTGPITSLDDPHFNVRQTYSVARVDRTGRTVLADNLPTPPVNIGPRSTPNYGTLAQAAVSRLPDGTRVFAGQRDDPFFVDLGSVFDLLGLRPLNSAHVIPLPNENGVDGLGGFNVHTIALQIPKSRLTHDGSPGTDPNNPNSIIGVYSETQRRQTRVLNGFGDASSDGSWVNVSRLGMPLVNEAIIPLGKKDKFNASEPANDAQFASYVTDPEPARLIHQLYGLSVPPPPRNDLVAIFLTGIPGSAVGVPLFNQPPGVKPAEMIRLNMGFAPSATPDRLGLLAGQLDGFPNGRRLVDDVVDIELRALAGGTPFTPGFNMSPNNALTDGVDVNDRVFKDHFPYLALPWQGYQHHHHRVGP